ncbi:MAG: L,D-transpeptidase [Deltaproteobacteria bacterium]|nr:L,D-transpeptidase [Deltaproteobacteria bacterium]
MKMRFITSSEFGLLLFVWIVSVCLLRTNPYAADSSGQSTFESGLVPSPLLYRPAQGSEYVILVDKSVQKTFVYQWKDLLSPLRTYQCSTGENDGPKGRQNDKKTPEGIYFFTHSYLEKDLAPIYGVRAFPIDYPNPMDKKIGNGGYGIWFHGTDKPLKPYDSNGCIVLENHHIEDLASFITLYDTPAVICSRIEMVERSQLEKEKREMLEIVENWRRAWQGKMVDQYMSFYSPRFTLGGRDWNQYKEYKARLARSYEQIMVDIENLWLLKNGSTILAKFDQRYQTERLQSEGEKRLYLQQNSKEWKIVGEFFERKALRRGPPKDPYFSIQEEIRQFILAWQDAWEEKDLVEYISCYDTEFTSRGMDLRAWKTHRDRLNRKYSSLNIVITDLEILPASDREAKVRFKQIYKADAYQDYGIKNLVVVKKGQDWRIKEEEWQPMQGD